MSPSEAGAGYMIVNGVLDRTKPYVKIRPITDDTSYAAALHELGHLLHPMGSLTDQCSVTLRESLKRGVKEYADYRDVRLTLESERAAWEWARQFAIEWTPTMDMVRKMCMATYLKLARRVGLKEAME